ncbi:hypothetical protein BP6252_01438 [Coleophoma cylindrospora]|uniref:Uncharacterized protein n=1 Tax=Coleophoma cylindrospora TaxID=1849047 RepID=A0A3D8SSX6_9HELO|nr:hypothetical protein BP6252_01438 [Coleophoma cylindrospora]
MSHSTPIVNNKSRAAYMKTGLGGAGNYHAVKAPMPTSSVPKTVARRRHGSFSIGIGGAGNLRSFKDKAVLTPEQEASLQIARQENIPEAWHFGIGGAGNRVLCPADASPKSETFSSSSLSSFSGSMSGADILMEKFGFFRRSSRDSS